jgi:hypothetical protein
VFVVVYFVINSVQKLLDTSLYENEILNFKDSKPAVAGCNFCNKLHTGIKQIIKNCLFGRKLNELYKCWFLMPIIKIVLVYKGVSKSFQTELIMK